MKLKEILDKYKLLRIYPVLGYELEFYLPKNNVAEVEHSLNTKLTQEKGLQQYEIDYGPFNDITKLAESVESSRQKLLSLQADLRPKPFEKDYGNSMHLHFNILNENGENLFENKYTLEFAANGICRFMRETLLAILTLEEDYSRFDANFMAPTHVCFGNNNRSVSVRIPGNKPSRLEHRLCSPLSDLPTAIFILLKSALWGIENRYQSYIKIFGNASDEQYKLEPLPKNIEEAKAAFNYKFFNEI